VPTVGPVVRRRELGALLRALRTERGWTVEDVAEHLLCSASKISRVETGQRGASVRDIYNLCDLYEITDQTERQRLSTLAREARQQTWWQARGLRSSTYYGLEADAASIRDCGFVVVPGLLQTADYARAVIRAVTLNLPPEEVDLRVQQRIIRQRLLDSARQPRFHAVIDEAVLNRVVGNAGIMQAQLEHLLEISQRPNVAVQILPSDAGAVPAGPNKFIILDFEESAVSSVVFIENLTDDLYLDRAEDVERYSVAFAELVEMAATPQSTRNIIAAKARVYRFAQSD
jgi:transcriptional regulator with XRE-family HTH domain